MRVKYEVMVNEFERVLKKYGFNEKNACFSGNFILTKIIGNYSYSSL